MENRTMSLRAAMDDVSASSMGGAAFLIAYGITFLITGVLSYLLPDDTVALIAMFQGAVALPVAFLLERRLSPTTMAADNPLRSLSVMLAVSQALAIPALIVAYNLNPRSIPVILAGLGGVHFLPYAWLHRTRIYIYLAVAVSLGAFALQFVLGSTAFHVILFYVGLVYLVAAPLVYRHARDLIGATPLPSTD